METMGSTRNSFRSPSLEAALSILNFTSFVKKTVFKVIRKTNETAINAWSEAFYVCLSWKGTFGISVDHDVVNKHYHFYIIFNKRTNRPTDQPTNQPIPGNQSSLRLSLTCLVSVWQISGRARLADRIVLKKLIEGTGDANPATFLLLSACLEVLKPKMPEIVKDLRFTLRWLWPAVYDVYSKLKLSYAEDRDSRIVRNLPIHSLYYKVSPPRRLSYW